MRDRDEKRQVYDAYKVLKGLLDDHPVQDVHRRIAGQANRILQLDNPNEIVDAISPELVELVLKAERKARIKFQIEMITKMAEKGIVTKEIAAKMLSDLGLLEELEDGDV